MDLVHIAKTVKENRQRQRLTIDAVAKKTGMSKGFISRLENFRVTPSLKSLNSIASALGITMAHFFEVDRSSPPYVFGSMKEGEPVDRDDAKDYGMKYLALAYQKPDRAMYPFVVTYSASKKNRKFLVHDAEEFFVLLEGKVEYFVYDETKSRLMKKGDTAYLAKNIPHTVRLAPGCKSARALIVYL